MNRQPMIANAALEAMLARRAGPGAPADLAASIATALDAQPEDRRRRWPVFTPPTRHDPAFRMAMIAALLGLLLAATLSAIYVGSELLRRTDQLAVVPPTETLTFEHVGEVTAVAWSPDGARLATGSSTTERNRDSDSNRETVKVWDVATGDEVLHLEQFDVGGQVTRIAYSPDGMRLAIAGFNPAVYDAITGDALPGQPQEFLAYSPDGTRIASGGAWGAAAVLDATTYSYKVQVEFPLAPSWMSDAAWSPDGTRLATSFGGSIKVWDAATGDELLTIGTLLKVTDIAYSPDGARIAAASEYGSSVGIWDAATGDELATLSEKGVAKVLAIAWSPDGSRIATASSGWTSSVWDAATGATLFTLTGHTNPVSDVAWSPDGTRIATASRDGTARIWPAVPPPVVPAPSASPAPSATLPPPLLRQLGEPIVSDVPLGTTTWRIYDSADHSIGILTGTPHGPVAIDGTNLLWLGPSGSWEGTALPEEPWGLAPAGDALIAYGRGRAHPVSWDGSRWVVGEPLDVPPSLLSSPSAIVSVAAGPRGTLIVSCQPGHCRGSADGVAVAVDGQHFVATVTPPGGGDLIMQVLATEEGFVALVAAQPDTVQALGSAYSRVEPRVWFSADGLAWEPRSSASPFGEGARIRSVADWDGQFVAVGDVGGASGSSAAWISDDGLAWQPLSGLNFEQAELCTEERVLDCTRIGVTVAGAGWVITTGDGAFWASAGRTWEALRGPAVYDWSTPPIAVGGDKIVEIGLLDPWGDVVVVGTIERPGGDQP